MHNIYKVYTAIYAFINTSFSTLTHSLTHSLASIPDRSPVPRGKETRGSQGPLVWCLGAAHLTTIINKPFPFAYRFHEEQLHFKQSVTVVQTHLTYKSWCWFQKFACLRTSPEPASGSSRATLVMSSSHLKFGLAGRRRAVGLGRS